MRKGSICSPECKKKISLAKIRFYACGGVNPRLGKKWTEEKKKQIGISRRLAGVKLHTEETKSKMALSRHRFYELGGVGFWLNKRLPLSVREKISKARKEQWQSPDFVAKMIKRWHSTPNCKEQFLGLLLGKDYKYVGNGDVIIGGKNPDFINVNGQKKVIELYGDYWHRGQNPQDRIDHFKKYGFDCLIIWEKELKDVVQVNEKIVNFS